MSDQIQDALSWDLFLNGSNKRSSYPPKQIDLENRLVCHTKNFFVGDYWCICSWLFNDYF